MALQGCKECGSQVSSSAKACPQCGAPVLNPNEWSWLKAGAIGTLAGVLCAAAVIVIYLVSPSRPYSVSKVASSRPLSVDLESFREKLQKADASGSMVLGVTKGPCDDCARVAVGDIWHGEVKQNRLQTAQSLWKVWASIRAPDEPDRARISLVDGNGNEVGGSRMWAGSLIWVQD